MADKKLTSYVCTITAQQLTDLQNYLQEHDFEFKSQQYAHFKAVKEKLNIVAYNSGKLTIQGGGTADFVEFVLEPEILHEFNFNLPDELQNEGDAIDYDLTPHIGVDESGKGDFFGGLVVAGVYIEESSGLELLKLGVKDSKKISDKQIVTLAQQIRNITNGKFAIVSLKPEVYNQLYDKIKNLNRLLAWGHARVIENVLEKVPDCPRALSDKFGSDYLIKNALLEKGRQIKLDQQVRAESDVAVAAASILARDHFLRMMNELSESSGETLPKGANDQVKRCAAAIIEKRGVETLDKCVKKHFKTYREVVNNE